MSPGQSSGVLFISSIRLEGTNNIEIQGAVMDVCKGLNNSSAYGKSYIDYSNVYEHIIIIIKDIYWMLEWEFPVWPQKNMIGCRANCSGPQLEEKADGE